MKETEVRDVIAKYLAKTQVKAIRQPGSGPDFLAEGTAIEVKGTKMAFGRALKQFTEYAFKYKALEIVTPWDGLDSKSFLVLFAWGLMLEQKHNKNVGVYIVTKLKEGSYNVRRYARISDFHSDVTSYGVVNQFKAYYEISVEDAIREIIDRFSKSDELVRKAIGEAAVRYGETVLVQER